MEHGQPIEQSSMHSDICMIDSVSVMEASKFMKLLPNIKSNGGNKYGICSSRLQS
jgi:hypothetical protein